jgi:hypothetical protein
VLIRHAATDADAKGLLLGSRDEPLSGLGNVQAGKVAEFLLDMKVRCCFVQCHAKNLFMLLWAGQFAGRRGGAVPGRYEGCHITRRITNKAESPKLDYTLSRLLLPLAAVAAAVASPPAGAQCDDKPC